MHVIHLPSLAVSAELDGNLAWNRSALGEPSGAKVSLTRCIERPPAIAFEVCVELVSLRIGGLSQIQSWRLYAENRDLKKYFSSEAGKSVWSASPMHLFRHAAAEQCRGKSTMSESIGDHRKPTQ